MHLVAFFSLFALVALSCAEEEKIADVDVPGGVLLASANTNWAPIHGKPATSQIKRSTIEGLLQRRQSCPIGYGECDNGKCCPIGGSCCKSGGCCGAGDWCHEGGCCELSQKGCKGGGCCSSQTYCAVNNDGDMGCCPIGETCSGDSGGCVDSEYVPCASYDFCCRAGYTCYRDSNNSPRCSPPGGGSTFTLTSATTRTSTSTSTSTSTTLIPTITTPAATRSIDIPAATPTGRNHVTYDASSASISWVGATWEIIYPTCITGITISMGKRTSSSGSSFRFTFTGGTAIYLSMTCSGAAFSVEYNGITTRIGDYFGGYTNTATGRGGCLNDTSTIVWSKTGLRLTDSRTVYVQVLDVPLGATMSGRAPWTLDFNQFVVDQSPSTSSNTLPSQTSASVSNFGNGVSTSSPVNIMVAGIAGATILVAFMVLH